MVGEIYMERERERDEKASIIMERKREKVVKWL